MAAEILLRPDNRALDFSTTDFSIYGAQPTTTVQFAPDALADGALPTKAPEQSATTDTTQPTAHVPDTEAVSPATEAAPGRMPDAADRLANDEQAPSSFQHSAVDASPLVPSPVGSGTPVTIGVATVAREGIDDSRATVDDTRAAADATSSTVSNVVAHPDGVLDALQPITVLPAATAALIANTVETTVQALDGTVTSTVDGLTGTVADTAATVETALNDTVTGAVDVAATTAEAGLDAVGTVADAVTPAPAPPAADLLGSASDAVADTGVALSQLAGSNPAAGVTTLVEMVATDNLFDLRDAGAPESSEPVVPPIDQLAGDTPDASPLLGEAAQQHDDAAHDPSAGGLHDDFGI